MNIKKPPFTWKDKEFWIGWYETRTYEVINGKEDYQVYRWGLLNKLAIGLISICFLLAVATPIIGLGFLLEYLL